jgi:hypothetical protein
VCGDLPPPEVASAAAAHDYLPPARTNQ